jgi:TPP-dependent pyruvate/acetoin dehydrogenase alpha subunit
MQRLPAYDPPEYVDWRPLPEVVEEYRLVLRRDPGRRARVEALDRAALLDIHRGLVRNRLHDIQLARWVKQGVISKAWLGTGEEAVTIGAVHALHRNGADGDVVAPMIRNAGACHEMGMSLADLFRAYLATRDTVLQGRDLHIGDLRHGVMAPISMVGSLVPVTAGIALAFQQRGEPRVALTWCGDGAVRTGEFHEGMSMAAARGLPLIVVMQNNQVALGTGFAAHSRVPLADVARAYVPNGAFTCHGNNVLDVFAVTAIAAERCRAGGGPVMIVAETGRMGGHATHDEAEARAILPDSHFDYWGKRDPIGTYEAYLEERLGGEDGDAAGGIVRVLEEIECSVQAEIDTAAREALASREHAPADPRTVTDGIYAERRDVDHDAGDHAGDPGA